MKKLFIIVALLFGALAYGQISTFNVANFVEITTAQRDGLTIGANQFPIIYNVTTGQHEQYNGATWDALGVGSEVNNLTAAVTWANVPDANVTQSSVTQHQAALSINESQIPDLNHTSNTDSQDLTLTVNTLAISGDPNTDVDLSGYLDNTDNQNAAGVPVTDAGANYTATDVEGVLAEIAPQLGSGESTTVSDTGEIDLTLSTFDISGALVTSSIDETKLDASTNASLDLADSAVQIGDTGTWTGNWDFAGTVDFNAVNVDFSAGGFLITPTTDVSDNVLKQKIGVDENNFWYFESGINGVDSHHNFTALTADRTVIYPDADVDLNDMVTASSTDTFTNKTISDFSNFVEADNIHVSIRNESGGTINRGDAVYISGYSVGQDRPLVTLADSDGTGTMPAFGLVEDVSIANNANGSILIVGRLDNVDTSGFTLDDFLYVSTTGTTGNTLTATRSTTPGVEVQKAGIVLRDHATLGVIEIFGAGRSNDIPNSMADDVFKVHGSVDDTKLVRIEADSLTTATTRTIHMRDADVDLNALTTDNIAPSTIKPLDLNVDNALTDEWFFAYETTTGNFKMVAGSTPSDAAYSGSWNGATTVSASQNAIYDEMEQRVPSKLAGEPTGSDLVTNIVSLTNQEYLDGTPVAGTVYIITDAKTIHEERIPFTALGGTLVTGTKLNTFMFTKAVTIVEVEASIDSAPVTGTTVIDINKNGTTIMTTDKCDIETGERSTLTATTAPALTTTAFAAGDWLSVDVDTIATTPGSTGHVYVRYTED